MQVSFPLNIPTWENDTWFTTRFETRENFRDFVLTLFKEPGKYNFDATIDQFNAQARHFRTYGFFTAAAENTKDYIKYWDDQKLKSRIGCIFKSGSETWYLPRDYYQWLNTLPIFDKLQGKFDFPQVWDTQYHIALYECLAELHYRHVVGLKKRQIAWEQPHSEPVLAEWGWSTMGDIQIGDKLWNPDGTLTTIIGKSNNGQSDVYQLFLGDGRSVRCGLGHRWEVYDRDLKKYEVLTTQDLLKRGLLSTPIKGKKKIYNNYKFAIDNVQAIPFTTNQSLLIDPYVMGCILGDGHISHDQVCIAGADNQIFDEISSILGSDYLLTCGGYCRKNITYKNRFSEECKKLYNGKFGCNPLFRNFKSLGLGIKGKNTKFIPEIYKTASIENRISLIQGMMDTDGYINSKGININFTNTNKRLIDDFTYVCRSLGLKVTIVKKIDKTYNSIFYRVLFSGNIPFDIFRLTRKKLRFDLRKDKGVFTRNPIVSIKHLGYKEESSCIVVDNPNHLYITRDFIVTHNSYFHTAKLINQLWFEEGVTLKMGASLKDYINEKGSWKYLNEYAKFLNEHTAWYRPLNPDKVMMWQQKIEKVISGKKIERGLKGTIQGISFDKNPTTGVGGPTKIFYYEEGGIAPTADQTYGFIKPALQMGMITTGIFIIGGSVGDLDQCGPLKEYLYHPEGNGFYGIESNLIDDKGTIGKTGLFIPEQWSMPPHIDQFGNSLVEAALKALDNYFVSVKKDMSPEAYQLEVSQHPRNISEAFAHRKLSKFPQHQVSAQVRRIEEKEYPHEYVDLYRDADGVLKDRLTEKLPISEFPLSKVSTNKEGVLVVWERPTKDLELGMYYASVDPVSEGRTTTSDSLCSIYVMKAAREVTRVKSQGPDEVFIERDKIVAAWTGRFDDLNKTHERLENIIEWYKAWTIIENNVSLFIQYMISKRKQLYMVPKKQIIFLKDLGANENVFQEYGWKNTGKLFKEHLLSYCIEYLTEELDVQTKEDGTVVKTTYGIERIPDIMAMKEMQAYEDGLNVDRLVALSALIAFCKMRQSNLGLKKVREEYDKSLRKPENFSKLSYNPFRHMGSSGKKTMGTMTINRSPFKHYK